VWSATKAAFEKEYTCYTLTMAGFAGVPAQAGASFKNWETAIAGYITANKIDQPIIVGHSMGGGLALAMAADYPQLVEKIVIVDALPCLAALMNPAFASKADNDCSAIVNQMTGMSDTEFEQMQKKSAPRLMQNVNMMDLVVSWSVKSDRKTFAEMYCDFSNTDLRPKVAAVKCPTLVLLESYFADASIKPAIEAQYKDLPAASLQYAAKGLHFIMYDDQEWYLAQLNQFIAGK
jgi:pimeloyl-ACP methyl ester carboxylesterase